MAQPQGYTDPTHPKHTYLLLKAIYGPRQAITVSLKSGGLRYVTLIIHYLCDTQLTQLLM